MPVADPTLQGQIDLLSRRSLLSIVPRSHALLRASCGPGRRTRQRGYQSPLYRTLERATRPADSLRGARRRGHRCRRDARPSRAIDPRTRHARRSQWLRGVSRLSLRDRQLRLVAVVVLPRGNPPSYHRYFKEAGFVTEKGQVDYTAPLVPEILARYRRMADAAAMAGVAIQSWREFGFLAAIDAWTDVTNSAFDRHWGWNPVTRAEVRPMLTSLWGKLPSSISRCWQ